MMCVDTLLYMPKLAIYSFFKYRVQSSIDQTNDKCDRLLLELMVAAGLSHKNLMSPKSEKRDDCKRHGIGDGSKCDRNLKFKSNSEPCHAPEAWLKIPHLRQGCDMTVVASLCFNRYNMHSMPPLLNRRWVTVPTSSTSIAHSLGSRVRSSLQPVLLNLTLTDSQRAATQQA